MFRNCWILKLNANVLDLFVFLKHDVEADKLDQAVGGKEKSRVDSSASKDSYDARVEKAKVLRELAEVCVLLKR